MTKLCIECARYRTEEPYRHYCEGPFHDLETGRVSFANPQPIHHARGKFCGPSGELFVPLSQKVKVHREKEVL